MIASLSRSARRLLESAWRGLVRRRPVPADSLEPTPDNIRKLLKRSPRSAYGAYLRYRDGGGEPHHFRPRELEKLISAGSD